MRIFLLSLGDQLFGCLADSFHHHFLIILILLSCLLLCFFNDSGHVLHVLQECHAQTLARKLLAAVHSPISVLEVVVLHAAELLDVAVAAVVVGHEKSLI